MNCKFNIKRLISCLVFIQFSCIGYLFAEYPNDTTTFAQLTEYATYIADINGDNIQDTLMSFIRQNDRSFPTSIHWGSPDAIQRIGIFQYPNWSYIDARAVVNDYDNDGKSDVMFYLWGNVQLDPNTKVDTGKVMLIWGQNGLEYLYYFNIENLGSEYQPKTNNNLNYPPSQGLNNRSLEQPQQFSSSILVKEKDIINPMKNSHNTNSSFEVKIPVRKNKKKTEEKSHDIVKDKWGISVYPNPNEGIIYLSSEQLPLGNYNIVIFDNTGKKVFLDKLTINTLGENTKKIELSKPENGIYHLVIHNKTEVFGKYKFVIVK